MPIPEFDVTGVLPAGLHDCTIQELADRFGCFQRSDRRVQLYRLLEAFLKEAEITGLFAAIIVDGSFVTSKPEPNDVDLILVLHENHDFAAQLRPFEYNLLSRQRVRKHFGFDLLIAAANSSEYNEFIDFFAQVRGRGDGEKGLIRIRL